MITPLLLVSIIALILTRKWSIYQKQVWNKFHSPAHAGDVTVNILENIMVKEAYEPKILRKVARTESFSTIKEIIATYNQECVPVVDESGNFVGVIALDRIKPALLDQEFDSLLIAEDIMVRPVTVFEDHSLYEALIRMLDGNLRFALVLDKDNPNHIKGILQFKHIIESYNREISRRIRE